MRLGLLLAMAVTIVMIGWLDIMTGPQIGMSLFYLAPISVTAWFVGRTPSIVLAMLAAIAWFASEVSASAAGMLDVSSWNGFTRLAIFVGSAVVLSLLREDRQRLHELLIVAEQSARTDPLTELPNSRAFHERLREELPRLQRRAARITLAYLDVDNFKRINDEHGHAAGDRVLKEIAAALRASLRAGDLPARIGGDEFAIALWDTELAAAHEIVDRLRAAIDEVVLAHPGTGLGVSIGLAQLDATDDLDAVLRDADAAMYAAKAERKAATS